ncbi:MAG: glycosyltransferase family 4 protein [Cryomorphaceae bacterium]|nr:glycosyltransferase family 4 protein [Cryomorphaceae bacterium]
MGKSILILNYEYPPLGGGAGAISKAHAEGLAKRGHRITVITTSATNSYFEDSNFPNLQLIHLPSKRKHPFQSGFREKLDWMFKAKNHCKKYPTDAFDFCMAHFSMPGGWVAKHLPYPFGIVSHGHDIPWFYPRQMFFYHLLLFPQIITILKKAKTIWVQSIQMEANAKKLLPNASVIKIPNGCSDSFIGKIRTLESGRLNILFAGRLVAQKRPDILLEAMRILKNNNIPAKLTIAGDGPLKSRLENSARDLKDYVTFAGLVSREQMPKCYEKHHVLLAPSEAEGMSISVLEAVFRGLYIIASPASGNPDLLQNSPLGSICEVNPEALAKTVMTFISNPPDLELRRQAHRDFIYKYNWDNIMPQYESAMFND